MDDVTMEKQEKPKKGRKKKDATQSLQQTKQSKIQQDEDEPVVEEEPKKGKAAKKNAKKEVKDNIKEVPAEKPGKVQKQSKEPKKNKPAPAGKNAKQPLIKEDAESLLAYFKEQNRPFTLNYLKDTLFLKASLLTKHLDQLKESGDLIFKEVGASKVYLINQSHFESIPSEVTDQLTRELGEKIEELKSISQENGKLQDQLNKLNKLKRLQDIEDEIHSTIQEIKNIDDKLTHYQSENFVRADESEIKQFEEENKKASEQMIKRKKMYERAIDTLLDGSEMTVQQFEAIIGVTRD